MMADTVTIFGSPRRVYICLMSLI